MVVELWQSLLLLLTVLTLANGCVVQELTIPLVLNEILCDGIHLVTIAYSRKVDIVQTFDAVSFCIFSFCFL